MTEIADAWEAARRREQEQCTCFLKTTHHKHKPPCPLSPDAQLTQCQKRLVDAERERDAYRDALVRRYYRQAQTKNNSLERMHEIARNEARL